MVLLSILRLRKLVSLSEFMKTYFYIVEITNELENISKTRDMRNFINQGEAAHR